MSIQTERFGEIADAIRSYTGETGGIAPNSFAEKIGDVFRAGQQSSSLEYTLVRTYKPFDENTSAVSISNVITGDLLEQYTDFIVLMTYGFAEAHSSNAMCFYARASNGSGLGARMSVPSESYTANSLRKSSFQFSKLKNYTFKYFSCSTKTNYTTDNNTNIINTGVCMVNTKPDMFAFEMTTPTSGTTYTFLADTQFEVYAR